MRGTVRGEVARLDAAHLALRRDPPSVPKPIPFARVTASPSPLWKAGTLWLDTGTVGPLGAHPLWVKLFDGSYTHVAWLVLSD